MRKPSADPALDRRAAAVARSPTPAAWAALLERARVPLRLRATLLASLAPTARAVPVPRRGARVGVSRLGGLPEVGPGFAWPSWMGEVLSFVGQLRLSELPPVVRSDLELPADGLLSFFYAADEMPWGCTAEEVGAARVYFWPVVGLRTARRPRRLPARRVLAPRRLAFTKTLTLAEPWSLLGAQLAVAPRAEAAWFRAISRWNQALGQPYHVVGGHAARLQPPPIEVDCALLAVGLEPEPLDLRRTVVRAALADAVNWRLLLQLDSDPVVGCSWGDAGKLSFWMREADLSALAFDRAGFALQCG